MTIDQSEIYVPSRRNSKDSKGPDVSTEENSERVPSLPPYDELYEEGSIDPVYQAKARLLSEAIQQIGMGKYQVGFLTCFQAMISTHCLYSVVFIFRRWLWVVCVSNKRKVVRSK